LPIPSAAYKPDDTFPILLCSVIINLESKIEQLRASTALSVQIAESRANKIEQDRARTVSAERSVAASVLSNMKKIQRKKDNRLTKEVEIVRNQVTLIRSALHSSMEDDRR